MSKSRSTRDTNVTFLSVAAFKKAIGCSSLEVVLNSKTDKLSVLADEDSFYRCQQNIDTEGRMAFLVPDNDLDRACLVNTSGDGTSPLTTQATL
jgi:hypothetical protein